MVLNVAFTNIVGKTIQTQLSDNFTFDEFKRVLSEKIDRDAVEHYRFVANNKDLCLENKDEFGKRKHLIKNGTTIFLLRRMHGGGYVEAAVLIDIIMQELLKELPKLRTKLGECVVCLDEKPCLKVCCNVICLGCFSRYFKEKDLQLKCMVCPRIIPYSQIFVSHSFIRSLKSLREIRGLMKHIDCQICHCGVLLVNETLYAQQKCHHCQRTFCFFCNKDWKDGQEPRTNAQYTCGVNCDYEIKLNYDLIPYTRNKEISIPNSRVCPTCFNVGGYDGKCKYHQCAICGYTFCFLCLASKEKCFKGPGSFDQQCAETKPQLFTIFPRIANS